MLFASVSSEESGEPVHMPRLVTVIRAFAACTHKKGMRMKAQTKIYTSSFSCVLANMLCGKGVVWTVIL